MMTETDVAIIGAGPAGITCAVQLVRLGIKVVLIDKGRPGGIIRVAWRVENFPPFPSGTCGEEIADRFEEHLASFDILPLERTVKRVQSGPPFILTTEAEDIQAQAVVLACGLESVRLDTPEKVHPFIWLSGELPPREGSRVLVIGSGDVAFDQAGRMAMAGFKVTLTHRKTRLKALPRIVKAAREAGVIILNSAAPDWQVTGEGVLRRDLAACGPFKYILPCIGRAPRPPALYHEGAPVAPRPAGSELETSCPGLFVAGDVCRGRRRQVSISMGDGMQVALILAERLSGKAAG